MPDHMIELEIANGIATLFLNRPDKRNAINDEMRAQLIEVLERVSADQQIRALVIAARGKGFCAGGDVSAMEQRLHDPAGTIGYKGWRRQQGVHHTQVLLHNLPIPTIAAVNGASSGLGSDTALACDFVFADRNASFAWAYIKRGLVPDGGGMYLLPRRVGLAKAKELIFTGRKVEAQEALALGIADRICDNDALVAEAQAFAAQLAANSPTALALTKSILNQGLELGLGEIFAQGSVAQGICYTSQEHQDSVRSFVAAAAARKTGNEA